MGSGRYRAVIWNVWIGYNPNQDFQLGIVHVKIVAMKIIGIIPARYASTRFPGKMLAPIAGKSLIERVVEQCQKAKTLSEVIVATDDTRIWEVTQNFCRTEMTSPDHPSGTDRLAEVAKNC